MREILFRGKNIEANLWEYGDLVRGADGKTFIHVIYQGLDIFKEVHPETVGQYTGRKDLNGHMVYEGDILQDYLDPDGILGEVIWDEDEASFYVDFGDEIHGADYVADFELYGNRWDDPEAIKAMNSEE